MAKSKPIGVRFDEEMLEDLKLSPQKALNLLTTAYYYDTKKIKMFGLHKDYIEIKNVFIDKDGKETSETAGKPIKVTITNKDMYKSTEEGPNKAIVDTKTEETGKYAKNHMENLEMQFQEELRKLKNK